MRDENGLYRISGRVDDIIMSKGHRIGTAELECAMVSTGLLLCIRVYTCTLYMCMLCINYVHAGCWIYNVHVCM